MHLIRLELYGFKSFANRTEFSFSPGITTLVGPNGCGKSNVVDAVRWVLGEQNLRTLRANKLADLIYAGSDKSEQKNYAEVAVVLDNKDNEIPLAYREVTIARRYYRSGESEYFLNRVPCRLKDINEVLASTSLGRGTYSIIGQGEVAEVITSRPEDRRLMFEEAAGIALYKMRKAEALKKLGSTQGNLQRVEDIIYELQTQVEELKDSSEKAKQFLELKKQGDQFELALWSAKYTDLNKRLVELTENCQALLTTRERSTAAIAQLEGQLQEATVAFEECSQFIAALEGNRGNLESDKTQKEYQLELALQRVEDYSKLIFSSRQRLMVIEEEVLELKRGASRLAEEHAISQEGAEEFIMAHKQRLLVAGLMKRLLISAENYRLQIDQLLMESIRASTEYATSKETTMELKSELEEQLANLGGELEGWQANQLAVKEEIEGYERTKAEIGQKVAALRLQKDGVLRKTEEINMSLEEETARKVGLEAKINANKQRSDILQNMEDDLQGYGPGVRAALKASIDGHIAGIYGAVGELVTVKEPRNSLAIETALGGALQYVVCDTEITCQKAIAFLKVKSAGRATFVPLTAAGIISKANNRKQYTQPILGWADELIHYPEEIEPVIKMLLGNVLVAESLKGATQLAKETDYRHKIVTVEGEVISRGLYTGGSPRKGQGPLLRRANLEELKEDLAVLTGEHNMANKNLSLLASQKSHLDTELLKFETKLQSMETELVRLSTQAEDAYHREAQLADREKTCEERFFSVKKKYSEVDQQLQSLAFMLNKDRANSEKLQLLKGLLTRGEEDVKDQLSLWTARQNSFQLAQFSLQNKAENAAKGLEAAQEKAIASEKEIVLLKDEVAQREAQRLQFNESIAASRQALVEIATGLEAVSASIEGQSTFREGIKTNIGEAKSTLLRLREENEQTISALHDLDLKKTRWETEIETLVIQLNDQYGLEPAKALSFIDKRYSVSQLAAKIKVIQESINLLGEVNLAAISQHEKLESRLHFLSGQQSDLIHASKDITSLVTELDETIRALFLKTFEQVQENFAKIFKTLFDGGSAYLALSEEGDPLEAGIDIFARPVGKRTQSLTLLSGGEKALTAIALLFALQSVRPSPFSILDEIEAALDDVNILRFTKYLRKLAGDMQFILITHRRETMEHSDSLYGITLNEEGASQPLSIVLGKDAQKVESQ